MSDEYKIAQHDCATCEHLLYIPNWRNYCWKRKEVFIDKFLYLICAVRYEDE